MDCILTAENLGKQYRHFKALDDFIMHVPKGSIYGFVGRNGAGKTTLIRLICGLQEPTEGSFTLYGVKSSDQNIVKARRRMGAVVETPAIYMDMSAVDNLKQQYRILGLPSFDSIPDLLKLLMQNSGQVIAKSVMLDKINHDTPDCTESSLKQHISNLRKKLRDSSGKDYIESVWGIGFMLSEKS